MWRNLLLLALLAAVVSVATSFAEETDNLVVLPDQIEWGPASPKLPAGAEMAVIVGDPSAPGELYVFRARLPDGYAVPPHTHPMDEHVTVLQGVMTLGFGERRDEEETVELTAGSYVRLPQGVPHFNRMQGETILQFHGIGPYDIDYVDAADDPSRQ